MRAANAARAPDEDISGGGEYRLTAEDFRRIAAILHEDSGIQLREGKSALVYSRLAKRLRALGLKSFKDYCTLISSDAGAEERRCMLTSLTTNVTRFFREPHHFDHLRGLMTDQLAARARSGGRLRFWSAACSSGEEPYSIGMTILGALPEAPNLDVRILATDIDRTILARAQAGVYPRDAVADIPRELSAKGLKKGDGDTFEITEELRELVTFRELNLMAPQWPMKGRFDAIFCRNVAIYFEDSAQMRLWARFAPYLAPEGRLYIGHSERVQDSKYETDGLTTYRLARPGR